MIYSIIFYGKELTCHEATDLSVSFYQHASSSSLKQHRHLLDHMIFLYIQNLLAMTSKMAVRVLNTVGARIAELWRFKAQKVKKTSRRRSFSHLQAWLMANGFFYMWQKMVPFSAGTNGK